LNTLKNYKELFYASLDAIVHLDLDFRIVEVNQSFISLFKYPEEALIGGYLDDFITPDEDKHNAKLLNDKVKKGLIFSSEGERITKNLERLNVIITGIPILENDELVGVFVIYKDVTIQRQNNKEIQRQKMIFESLFTNATDAMVKVDKDKNIVAINESFENCFGYSIDEIKGVGIDRLISESGTLDHNSDMTKRILTGEKVVIDGKRRSKDGTLRDYLIKGVPIIVDDEVTGVFGIYTDINALVLAQKEIAAQKVIFESLFKNSSDAIARFDLNHSIIQINENFTELFGYDSNEIIGMDIDVVVSGKENSERATHITQTLLQGQKVIIEGTRYHKSGKPLDLMIKGVPIIESGNTIGGYGIYTDIAERKKSEAEILYISYHDQLTNIYNRRFFEEEMKRIDYKRNYPISMIMADVNGLKLANDAFGHEAGDALLKRLAQIIVNCCRGGEIVARLGGDEFIILLPNTTTAEAEIIVNRIKRMCKLEQVNKIELSMSFGWDSKTDESDTMGKLFKRVEDFMYRNKLIESPSIRGKMFEAIIKTLHEKNSREERHSSRVSKYSEQLARFLGYDTRFIEAVKTAGWLHDIGKIGIDESVLNKEGKLSNFEWNEIRKHPEIGYRILNSVNEMSELAEYILAHHERFDGKGYPKGLKGDSIPIQSRIIAIADAYDAMTTERTYRPTFTKQEAFDELLNCSGTQFAPDLVLAFVECMKTYES